MLKLLVTVLLTLLCACSRSAEKKLTANAKSLAPDKAIASMKLAEDFHVELFAAEPMVADPVDIVFDEKGRAFVAEMLDLPDDPAQPFGAIHHMPTCDLSNTTDTTAGWATRALTERM